MVTAPAGGWRLRLKEKQGERFTIFAKKPGSVARRGPACPVNAVPKVTVPGWLLTDFCHGAAPRHGARRGAALAARSVLEHRLRRRRRLRVSWPASNPTSACMHSINVALAKHAGAHFAHRCRLQNGLRLATCAELLESSTCAALRGVCYPSDVSQRVTPHMRQRPGRLGSS